MDNPKHIGIIMDGNRRWAEERGLHPWKGHEAGVKALKKLLDYLKEKGLKELTLYTFSIQNFNRSEAEKKFLFEIFELEFKSILKDKKSLEKNQTRISFLGKLELFPKSLREVIKQLSEATKIYDKHILNFAFGYGGREEILEAVNKALNERKTEISEEEFENYLYTKSKPDLIIRTSKEKRTSGFLVFQGAYAELFFVDKYWPDFTPEDMQKILEEYHQRERRFGK